MTRGAQQTSSTLNRIAVATRAAQRGAVAGMVRDVDAGERAKRRAFQETSREAQRTFRATARDSQRAEREMRQVQRATSRRGVQQLMGGGIPVLGAVLGGLSIDRAISELNERLERRFAAIASHAGVQDAGAGLVSAQELETRIRRLIARDSGSVNLDANVAATTTDINAVATRTGIAQGDIVEGLGELQQLGAYDLGRANMEQIAEAARGGGHDFAALSQAVGATARSFDVLGGSAEDQRAAVQDILGLIERSGLAPERFAATTREPLARFLEATGQRGREGIASFTAAQAIVRGETQTDAAGAASMLGDLGGALGSRDVRRALERRGIRGRSLADVVGGASRLTARARGQIFEGDALRALEALISREGRDPGALGRLGAAELEAGTRRVGETFRAVQGGSEARTLRLGAEDRTEHLGQVRGRSDRFAWGAEALTAFDQLRETPDFESDWLATLTGLLPRGFAGSMLGDRARAAYASLPSLDARGRPVTEGRVAGALFPAELDPLNPDIERRTVGRTMKAAASRDKERAVAELGSEAAERFASAMRSRPLTVRVEGPITVGNMPDAAPGTGATTPRVAPPLRPGNRRGGP